jgi:large subunit ribosomal protein L21
MVLSFCESAAIKGVLKYKGPAGAGNEAAYESGLRHFSPGKRPSLVFFFTPIVFSQSFPQMQKERSPMFTIIEQAGFQFKVAEGDTIRVPRMQAEQGSEVTLGKVLMVCNGDQTKIGSPAVDGAIVKAKVLEHGKADKVLIMKKKRRKDYKVRRGHRQTFTKLQITSIAA